MTNTTDNLKTKIAALIRKANDSSTTQQEREAFLEKVEELLSKHQLSMLDISEHERNQQDPLNSTPNIILPYKDGVWISLTNITARYYNTRAVFFDTTVISKRTGLPVEKMAFDLVGRESARITAELMIPYIWKECNRKGRAAYKNKEFGKSPRNAVHQVMSATTIRLLSLLDGRDIHQASNEQALMCANEIEAYMQENISYSSGKSKITAFGRAAVSHASSISLEQQVTNRSQLAISGS